MMIDWLSLRLNTEEIGFDIVDKLMTRSDRIFRTETVSEDYTGDDVIEFIDVHGVLHRERLVWETRAWESIRSDTHGLSFHITRSCIRIQGSPARVMGTGCNVFGSLDIMECFTAMVVYASSVLGIQLPTQAEKWHCSRIDVTGNLLLDSLADVRIALRYLRDCEGGRYRVSQQAGDTVYWSHKSRLFSGKAYAKGPHIRHMIQKEKLHGITYFMDELELIDRLLRLELTIGSQQLRERMGKPWHCLSERELANYWNVYFMSMIGDSSMNGENELVSRLLSVCPTKAQAQRAYECFRNIQSLKYEQARVLYSERTWYRHIKYLRQAGLADLDLSHGQIIPFRRKIIECVQVSSWDELRKAA